MKVVQLTLIVDTDEDPSVEQIKNDLMTEINCASYYYELVEIKEIKHFLEG